MEVKYKIQWISMFPNFVLFCQSDFKLEKIWLIVDRRNLIKSMFRGSVSVSEI